MADKEDNMKQTTSDGIKEESGNNDIHVNEQKTVEEHYVVATGVFISKCPDDPLL